MENLAQAYKKFSKEGNNGITPFISNIHSKEDIINNLLTLHIDKIDFTKPVRLYAQTTKSVMEFKKISSNIQNRMKSANDGKQIDFITVDSICGQVANRAPKLKEFSQNNDVIIFVSDKKSSNGEFLYKVCKEANPNSFFVSEVADIKKEWFKIIVIILLSIVVISYASGQYVYYQKQQIQLQEMQKEQKAKEEFYPTYLEIQEVKKRSQEEADKMVNDLSEEEWRIYKLLKEELN